MANNVLKKPILFATLGFPGSGKTFFSRRFARAASAFHLNSDKMRGMIFRKPKYSAAENAIVFRVMDLMAGELLRCGVNVIYDANSTKRGYRKHLQDIAKKRGARYLLLWFKTPVSVALKRIGKRGVPRFALWRIRASTEEPRSEPYVVIDGEAGYKEQKRAVTRFLRQWRQ